MKFKTFCAANSGEGFISLFDSLLDERKQQVYYIKGGPGCGKSTLMKQIAQRAEHAELIQCSGDPDSLDGVVLPQFKSIIIDATAPHCYDPIYPGVGGTIIDLGVCWQPKKLDKTAIILCNDHKKEIYKSCYALLKGAKQIHQGIFQPLSRHLSLEKLKSIGDKILKQNALWEKSTQSARVKKRFLSAITPDGCMTCRETFSLLGRNIIILEDRWMLGNCFLQHIHRRLNENGIDHIIGCHPLLGETYIHHLIVPKADLSIVNKDGLFPIDFPEESIIQKIVLQRMIDKNYLSDSVNKYSFMKRLIKDLLNTSSEKLQEARQLHLKLEKEYAKGIDFSAADQLKENLNNILFGSP